MPMGQYLNPKALGATMLYNIIVCVSMTSSCSLNRSQLHTGSTVLVLDMIECRLCTHSHVIERRSLLH